MTEFLFREDSYLQSTPATVTALTPEGGVVLDRTVFYAASGGQPGDNGVLRRADGSEIVIATTVTAVPSAHDPAIAPLNPSNPPTISSTILSRAKPRFSTGTTVARLIAVST